MTMTRVRIRAACWVLFLAVLGFSAWTKLHDGRWVEPDTLSLLEDESAEWESVRSYLGDESRALLVALDGQSISKLDDAAREIAGTYRTNGAAQLVSSAESVSSFKELILPHRFGLLTPEYRRTLELPDPVTGLLASIRSKLASAEGPFHAKFVEDDPLLILPDILLEQGKEASSLLPHGDFLLQRGPPPVVILPFHLKGSAFSKPTHDLILPALEAVRARGIRVRMLGVLPFAAESASSIEREIVLVGTVSTVAILLITALAFRSLWPVAGSLVSASAGLIVAFGGASLLLDRVHLISVAFAGSLLGSCVDYAMHFYATRASADENTSTAEVLRTVIGSITVGILTSAVALAALLLTPFPAMYELALFSLLGLCGSYGTVVLLFPAIIPSRRGPPPAAVAAGARLFVSYERFLASPAGKTALAAVIAVWCLGIWELESRDDVRLLQSPPERLIAEQRGLAAELGRTLEHRFVLVTAGDDGSLLDRIDELDRMKGGLGGGSVGFTIASMVPPYARQRAAWSRMAEVLIPRFDDLARGLSEIGFSDSAVARLRAELSAPIRVLTLGRWRDSAASLPLRHLVRRTASGGWAASVRLSAVDDDDTFARSVAAVPGAKFIDQVASISSSFGRYRTESTTLLMTGYLVVSAVFLVRYGVRRLPRIVLPLLLVALGTLGTAGLLGLPLNFFSFLALVIVLGLCADYVVFVAEDEALGGTALALILSTFSAALGFGLLSLSSMTVLKTFGFTLGAGVAYALALAPLARRKRSD